MASESDLSRTEFVTKPGPHDVLCGRGSGFNNHCGNVKFRQLVNAYKLRYMSVGKLEKPKVAREVVQLWRAQDPPGRFLGRTDDSPRGTGSVRARGSVWFDVGDKKAREKASDCLRRPIEDVFPSIWEMQRQQDILTAFSLHVLECQTSKSEITRAGEILTAARDESAMPAQYLAAPMQQNSHLASLHQDNFNSRLIEPYPQQWGGAFGSTPFWTGYLASLAISSGLPCQDMSLLLQKQNQDLPLETHVGKLTAASENDGGRGGSIPHMWPSGRKTYVDCEKDTKQAMENVEPTTEKSQKRRKKVAESDMNSGNCFI